jgi:hypothetical protein
MVGCVHTPVRPLTRFVGIAKSAQVRIRTSSRRRTKSTAPRVFRRADGASLRSTSEAAEIEDGVADDLSGAVESDIAAAVAFEKFDAALGKHFGRRDYVGGFGVAAQRDDWLVFEQEQDIADLLFFAQRDQLLLQAQARGVVECPELDDGNH